MTKEIKNETDALKEAGRKTCLKHVHAFREGDVWYCIPCTDSILTPRPYTIIKAEQNKDGRDD